MERHAQGLISDQGEPIVRNSMLAVGLSAVLAACGQGGTDPAEEGAGAGEAQPAAVATTAGGAPIRAAGLWELKNLGGGGEVIGTQTLCVDAASEEKASLFDQIARNTNCSKYEITSGAGTWAFEFVCGSDGFTSTSKGTVSGDFASSYRVEMTDDDGTVALSRTIEGTRSGDCPAGVAPGTLHDEQGNVVADITG